MAITTTNTANDANNANASNNEKQHIMNMIQSRNIKCISGMDTHALKEMGNVGLKHPDHGLLQYICQNCSLIVFMNIVEYINKNDVAVYDREIKVFSLYPLFTSVIDTLPI